MSRRNLNLVFLVLVVFSTQLAISQEKSTFSLKTSAELVSSYVWRGSPSYSTNNGQTILAPNIQPTLGFIKGNFEIGAWGSTDFSGTYQEMDLYASYTFKHITATITDYYWAADWSNRPYFSYKNETTGHILEGMLVYKGNDIPFSLTVATMLYGADKKFADSSEVQDVTNNYSTYLELGYSFKVNEYNFDAFLGMTPMDGFYGDGYGNVTGFGVVNVGLTGYKKIQLSEKYETTLRSSVVFNPQQNKSYIVLGITF